AEELDRVGDDLDRLALVALAVVELAPLQPAVDRHGAALLEVGRAVLALLAPDGDVEVVRLLDPLAGGVLAAGVAGDAEAADRGPAGGAAQFRVPGQVPGDDDAVDVHEAGAPSAPGSLSLGRVA